MQRKMLNLSLMHHAPDFWNLTNNTQMGQHRFETLLILSKASSDATNDFLKSPSHESLDKLLATSSAVIAHCEQKLKEHQKNEVKSRD